MARPRNHQSSTDVEVQIRRLQEEKQRLITSEDQRRGALIREYLAGSTGADLRDLLRPIVSNRDAVLFGLEPITRTPRPAAAKNDAVSVKRASAPSNSVEATTVATR